MKIDPAAGKNPRVSGPQNHFGPRPVGALLTAVTRPAFRKRSPATASLLMDWAAIVGPSLAALTRPSRFSAGTLTLGCSGPVALELQHETAVLLERINTHLGRPVVARIRFFQEPGLHGSNAAVSRRRARLDPVYIENLADGPLRDALASLGAEVLADHA